MPVSMNSCRHYFFFFFSSRRRHTSGYRDWSSDVCSSDLGTGNGPTDTGEAPSSNAADLASLEANTLAVERLEGRRHLRKEPRLCLLGHFQFQGGAAFGFPPVGMRAALRLDLPSHLFRGQKRKRVPVDIFEGCGHRAPRTFLRLVVKAHPALTPFFELGKDILGQESNLSGPANELILVRLGIRSDQRKHGSAIRRGNG